MFGWLHIRKERLVSWQTDTWRAKRPEKPKSTRYVSVWCDMCLLGVMCNLEFALSHCVFYVSRPIEARPVRKSGQQINKPLDGSVCNDQHRYVSCHCAT